MKFTVLGATGFVGSHLVGALHLAGHQVDTPAREANLFSDDLGHVIYCIGLTADFRSRPFDTINAHVSMLNKLVDKGRFASLLYLSSTRVYQRTTHGDEGSSLTVDVSDPSDLYNISKIAGEAVCLACSPERNVRIARLSNVYGPPSGSANFLEDLLCCASAGQRIVLRTAPESAKDYVSIVDVVDILPRIAVSGSKSIYNVASGHNLSHRAIVERLDELTNCGWAVREGAPQVQFPAISTARLGIEFAYAPARLIDDLPALLQSYKGN